MSEYKGNVRWKIKGVTELERKLDNMMGDREANKVIYPVLQSASANVLSKLKTDMLVFKDTGATINEVIAQNPRMDTHGVRTVKIGWSDTGAKQRWRMVHLNEYGYTRYGRRYTPRGFGVIGRSVESSIPQYEKELIKGIKKWLKI